MTMDKGYAVLGRTVDSIFHTYGSAEATARISGMCELFHNLISAGAFNDEESHHDDDKSSWFMGRFPPVTPDFYIAAWLDNNYGISISICWWDGSRWENEEHDHVNTVYWMAIPDFPESPAV